MNSSAISTQCFMKTLREEFDKTGKNVGCWDIPGGGRLVGAFMKCFQSETVLSLGLYSLADL